MLLIKAKNEAGHGNWEPLFDGANPAFNGAQKAGFAFGKDQATRYLKLEKDFKLTREVTKGIEPFNLEKTCKLLAAGRRDFVGVGESKDRG